jgi:hypothetical protein
MHIGSSGNVGIGGTPTAPLHVFGAGILGASSTNPIAFTGSGGQNAGIGSYNANTDFNLYAAGTANIKFRIGAAWTSAGVLTSTGTEAMRIDSSGNLLVGTTSSSNTSGSGVKISKPSSDGKIMVVGATSTDSQDGYQLYSTGASAFRFFVQYTGQINATSTSINGISDVSLKENIRDLDKGLETILALQPRRFDWKNGDGNDIMGFVAQEVKTVLPELVHDYKYNHQETKLGLKMGDMIPTLVKAIQEQQATITALTARIEQLEDN